MGLSWATPALTHPVNPVVGSPLPVPLLKWKMPLGAGGITHTALMKSCRGLDRAPRGDARVPGGCRCPREGMHMSQGG